MSPVLLVRMLKEDERGLLREGLCVRVLSGDAWLVLLGNLPVPGCVMKGDPVTCQPLQVLVTVLRQLQINSDANGDETGERDGESDKHLES